MLLNRQKESIADPGRQWWILMKISISNQKGEIYLDHRLMKPC